MTKREELEAKMTALSTEQLIEITRTLNLDTRPESVIVALIADNILESRLSEEEFLALMEQLEAELLAAE